MLGSISGDISGSNFEGSQAQSIQDFLSKWPAGDAAAEFCVYSDDTVCTLASMQHVLDLNAKVILNKNAKPNHITKLLQTFVKDHPHRGYGGKFYSWAHSNGLTPEKSRGNGAAMRISPYALWAKSMEELHELVLENCKTSHDSPEAIAGAFIVACAVFYGKELKDKKTILNDMLDFLYDEKNAEKYEACYCVQTCFTASEYLAYFNNIDKSSFKQDLALGYGFSSLAVDTCPLAVRIAFRSNSWLEAVAQACLLGGDSDTIACMAGGIAEVLYGIPDYVVNRTRKELSAKDWKIVTNFYALIGLNINESLEVEKDIEFQEMELKLIREYSEDLAIKQTMTLWLNKWLSKFK